LPQALFLARPAFRHGKGRNYCSTKVASPMPAAPDRPSSPQPLRRKRVKAVAAPSPARRKTLHGLLIFITLVLVIDGLVGEKGLMETLRARRHYGEVAASLERLRAENAALREQARRLREDPAAIESLARQELGLIRPGEMLFIVKDAKPPKP
jgi:cell division protein FtsB